MKILILRTWLRNIGNGIIEKGCRAALTQAFPDADIYESSGYPFVSADLKERGEFNEIFMHTGRIGQKMESAVRNKKNYLSNVFNIADSIADIDLVVLPGCVLYDTVIRPYMNVLRKIQKRDIPLLLLGVGGGNYNPETIDYVSKWMKEQSPVGIITRDSEAYSHYSDIVKNSYNGIDCGFFINDWYTPPKSRNKFKAATFDKIKGPEIESSLIVRPDHNPFGDARPYQSIPRILMNRLFRDSAFRDKNVLVSDTIEDYLYVYANAKQTHSDRIHACVPALAYGNEARFYLDTPREGLFNNMSVENISRELVRLPEDKLMNEKEKQINKIQEFVENH